MIISTSILMLHLNCIGDACSSCDVRMCIVHTSADVSDNIGGDKFLFFLLLYIGHISAAFITPASSDF